MTTPVQIPRQKPNLQLQDFDGELVLYDLEKMQVIYLSETATLIWQLCDGERSIPEIVQLLQDAYPEQAGKIPDDVESAMVHFEQFDTLDWV
jgi:hypothetical protein